MSGPKLHLALAVASLLLLAACGGGGGGVASVSAPAPAPAPVPVPVPVPVPTPTPTDYNTAEYQRSNAAVQARAITAYGSGATGAGVLVGVIDSGVAGSNPEFAGKISSQSGDFAGNRGVGDEGGHGTAVSEVLLGAKNDSGVHGVAFDANLLVLRADTPGSCAAATDCSYTNSAMARGLDRAVTAGAKIVNISLGGAPASSQLRTSIDRATAAGVIIVISAGNEFDTTPATAVNPDPLAQIAIDPVSHGLVVIAGATDTTQTITNFSNRAGNSAAFYLTALGVRVRTIDQTGETFLYSGTSLSTPIVSGALALLAQAFPGLTPTQLVDLLLRTATDLGAAGVDGVYGHGELNIARAFQPVGATSIAGATVSLTDNAMLSPAMGDAAQIGHGLPATIRDSYGRDFAVDLATTLRRVGEAPRLLPALDARVRGVAAAQGKSLIALALAGEAGAPLAAVSGSVVTRLTPRTALAFGMAQGSGGLARSLQGDRQPGFLITTRGDASEGFARTPASAVAVRQAIGRVGLTAAAEQGEIAMSRAAADPLLRTPLRAAYTNAAWTLDAGAGPLRVTAGVARLIESETVLGAHFAPVLGGGGAATWFADATFGLTALGWRLAGAVRQGFTRVTGGALRDASILETQALSVEIARDGFALRYAEPLRVRHGSLDLIALDARLDLAPRGHERDVEAAWSQPVAGGSLAANLFWRREPGNIAAAPDDRGIALRYQKAF